MSRWGLYYKGAEIVAPEEWNNLIDALNELDTRVVGGQALFTGDGSTTVFNIPHGLGETPLVAIVGKGATALPDIDYWTADSVNISVVFKTPPPSGADVRIWWIAVKMPSSPSA
jgi:hypothetical protein